MGNRMKAIVLGGTSGIGKSIANSMGREFVRLSLGGIRDEAEY